VLTVKRSLAICISQCVLDIVIVIFWVGMSCYYEMLGYLWFGMTDSVLSDHWRPFLAICPSSIVHRLSEDIGIDPAARLACSGRSYDQSIDPASLRAVRHLSTFEWTKENKQLINLDIQNIME
jgi:hypothetical protein